MAEQADRPVVVLLNGVGSAGKGSIAKALQQVARRSFLHVEMDAFLEMLPARSFGRPEGLVFERLEQEGKPAVAVHSGPLAERALAGMRGAVAALAAAGNDLIVDEVIWGTELEDYRRRLAACRLYLVGVVAPLEVLEARERQRGDREIGLARWQFARMHRGVDYDLTVDSGAQTPEDCAERIRRAFDL